MSVLHCCLFRALLAYLILFIIVQLTVVYSVLPLIWSALLSSSSSNSSSNSRNSGTGNGIAIACSSSSSSSNNNNNSNNNKCDCRCSLTFCFNILACRRVQKIIIPRTMFMVLSRVHRSSFDKCRWPTTFGPSHSCTLLKPSDGLVAICQGHSCGPE